MLVLSIKKQIFFIGYAYIILTSYAIIGCIGLMQSRTDVTGDQSYWGGYKPGMTVLLVQDVYLLRKNSILLPENYFNSASSPKNFEFKYPESFIEYLKSPENYPELKILKKGTTIKCSKIYFVDNITWATIDILGFIENGDYKNYSVSLRFLSDAANLNEGGLLLLKPDSQYLHILNTDHRGKKGEGEGTPLNKQKKEAD